MRFNIKKLESAGFVIHADKDSIEILAPVAAGLIYEELKETIKRAEVNDPGLQDYVLNATLIALERAQILELAE